MIGWVFLIFGLSLGLSGVAVAAPSIVAAESVYADIADSLAGAGWRTTALMTNPAADPHLFEVGPDAARALGAARIVIYNGAGYDPWMRDLLAVTAGATPRRVIDVADLVHAAPGANPHLWYDPAAIDALAGAMAAALTEADPSGATGYATRLAGFRESLIPIRSAIATLRHQHPRVMVAATEPVFGPMLAALGFHTVDPRLEIAVQNDTEPPAAAYGALLDALRQHQARLLIVNTQTVTDLTRSAEAAAHHAGIPIVAITESEPAGKTYAEWVSQELAAIAAALNHTP